MSQKLEFSKKDFDQLELADLIINIWTHSSYGKKDDIIKNICQWCIECAREKWSYEHLDFGFVMRNLLTNNKNFDFGKI